MGRRGGGRTEEEKEEEMKREGSGECGEGRKDGGVGEERKDGAEKRPVEAKRTEKGGGLSEAGRGRGVRQTGCEVRVKGSV